MAFGLIIEPISCLYVPIWEEKSAVALNHIVMPVTIVFGAYGPKHDSMPILFLTNPLSFINSPIFGSYSFTWFIYINFLYYQLLLINVIIRLMYILNFVVFTRTIMKLIVIHFWWFYVYFIVKSSACSFCYILILIYLVFNSFKLFWV